MKFLDDLRSEAVDSMSLILNRDEGFNYKASAIGELKDIVNLVARETARILKESIGYESGDPSLIGQCDEIINATKE